MAKKVSTLEKIGSIAFIIGVIIALLIGIVSFGEFDATLVFVLIVMGLIVGLLNVGSHETTPFLMSTVSLVIVTALGGNVLGATPVVGKYLASTLSSLMTFVIPATIIVALKTIYALAQDN